MAPLQAPPERVRSETFWPPSNCPNRNRKGYRYLQRRPSRGLGRRIFGAGQAMGAGARASHRGRSGGGGCRRNCPQRPDFRPNGRNEGGKQSVCGKRWDRTEATATAQLALASDTRLPKCRAICNSCRTRWPSPEISSLAMNPMQPDSQARGVMVAVRRRQHGRDYGFGTGTAGGRFRLPRMADARRAQITSGRQHGRGRKRLGNCRRWIWAAPCLNSTWSN